MNLEQLKAQDLHLEFHLCKHVNFRVSQVLGEDLRGAEGEPDILLQRPEDLPDPSRGHLQGRALRRPDELHR